MNTTHLLAALLCALPGIANAADCTLSRYHLVFAINDTTGVGGFSQATATACAGGLTETEIRNFRQQIAEHHRKKNPGLADDQIILIDFKQLRQEGSTPSKQSGFIAI